MMMNVLSLLESWVSGRATRVALAVAIGWGSAGVGTAATLSMVPMQGSMAMPMVAYRAAEGRLHVMMPADVPQLTPLMVSNPADGFDPAAPWFDALDPSRRGLAFSRRYGFVMDSMSDPLPADTATWIRKLAGPPELEFYRYFGKAPVVWEPIFGTAGAPEALFWNGLMFHPVMAAPPGANPLSATFEVFLVDTTTSLEIPGSASGPLEFNLNNLPDGRPVLDVGPRLVVTWPAETAGYELECADSVGAADWIPVTNTVVVLDGLPTVVIQPEAATMFFRMRKSP